MVINYLDENLLQDKNSYYVVDKNFLNSIKYYIRRKCEFERINLKIEKEMLEKYGSELNDIINYHLNIFINNYANMINRIPKKEMIIGNMNAYNYLQNTYPYCLFKDGNVGAKDLDSALLYFAKKNLSATDNKLDDIINVLRALSIRELEDSNLNNYKETYDFVRYSYIYGSINPKYNKENLYDTLHALDDRDLKQYINYIMVNDGLTNAKNIMQSEPIVCMKGLKFSYNNVMHVVEGSHRLILCRALHEITSVTTLNCFYNDPIFHSKVLIKK